MSQLEFHSVGVTGLFFTNVIRSCSCGKGPVLEQGLPFRVENAERFCEVESTC